MFKSKGILMTDHTTTFTSRGWALELNRCLNGTPDETGFRYLCRKFLQFKGKDPIGFFPLILNPVQDYLLTQIRAHAPRRPRR